MTAATPDPAAADPMPAAALGMWLFVAGEAMFFAGLLSAYLVLQSPPGEHALFVRSAAVVSRPLTGLAAVLLVGCAGVLWQRPARVSAQVTTALLAVAFLAVQAAAGGRLLSHHTVITPTDVYDGSVANGVPVMPGVAVTGLRLPLPPAFDVSGTMPDGLRSLGAVVGTYSVPTSLVRADAAYGPSRNNYFACYFLVGAAHAAHVIGGLVALGWLIVRTRWRTATPVQVRAVALYWQFLNGVGLLSLLLLSIG